MFNIRKAAVALSLILAANHASAEEKTAWRLFVADHAAPVVRAIDALTGNEIDNFKLKGPARLYATSSARMIFAVQRDDDVVSAMASGIVFGDHGDHGDITIEPPRLLDAEVHGRKPVHFVEHKGDIALFFDDEGLARVFSEKTALEGNPIIREVATSSPHHGVAAALGDHVLVTEPHPEKPADELPIGIKVLDATDARAGETYQCPDLHGEATSGNLLALACAEGLLIVRPGKDGPEIKHLPYRGLPSGKSTTLIGGKGLQYFLGNYGPDAVVLVDPEGSTPFRLIELPTRRVHFAVDPIRSKFAYVFTEDGKLHRIDVISGALDGSIALTEPYSMDGHWNDPRPRIAVAGDRIAVTDPLKGLLHLVDAATFAKAAEIAVEGKPFNIVAVGGSGEAH
ncbi:zinc metallochaperone AztD [Mesorhizobium sp. L-8-3]|uniref:zinc metallochaperone AztD n=1 Tax=Mesorhizobium sp. L-8-3 TaxID=2744522 RepID=UPI001927A181|nr:zinc metallochaperone AztD [Mesorhizobium sp. L-8-3]BCH26421.1 hypothetical protein MesoLjLb_62060 [Mesorhizobium sp. L-8-3]